MLSSFKWSAGVLVLAVLATGCDSAGDAGQAGATSQPVVRKQVNPEAARLAATMVSAVSATGGPAGSVDVKFELTQRPQVGQPVDISVALIPTAPLERLYARFQAGDGLELVQGVATPQFARPATGAPIAHSLTAVPQRDGIFTILAVVLMDSQTESVSRNFSIPVIAGTGLSDSSAYVDPPQNPPHR